MTNDLDWEDTQQPQDQQVDDVVDEALGYEQEGYQGSEVLEEAIERIEQAKLYESLIKHDFFGPGSARQEIQDRVTREIRGFILERLEILLGIKSPASKIINVKAISQFDDAEIDALKEIAGRLIQKSRQIPERQIEPQVQQYSNQTYEPKPQQTKPLSPKVNQVRSQPKQTQRQSKSQPKSEGLASTPEERLLNGTYKPQAVSKTNPPKPMPNQMMMNMMNAQEVAKRQATGATGVVDQMLRLAINTSQAINKDVIETLNE